MNADASGGDGTSESGSSLADAVTGETLDGSGARNEPGQPEEQTLTLQDVLQGLQTDSTADVLGVYLSLENDGRNTVISMDTSQGGASVPILIATLDNVTGVTLQLLLNDCHVGG